MTVEETLTEMQRLVRLPAPTEVAGSELATFVSGRIPDDLATADATVLMLQATETRTLEALRYLLTEDRRFEYMSKTQVDESTWRFVCLAHFRHEENHVDGFVGEHAQELKRLTCFFPVEDLTVAAELEAYGARFIPADAVPVPEKMLGPDPQGTMASAIAVDDCTGTNYGNMAARAGELALHALRVLRAVLREDHFIHPRQLRFRLGESTWFSDSASGWESRPERGWGYELREEALKLEDPPPVSALRASGGDDVEQAANRALRWFEQAQLGTDPLLELLYLFFALEAIVGDTEREKGRKLAVRRAILGHKTTGRFTHPGRAYLYYGRVRSTAVHGGDAPEVPRDEVDKLAWDVRRAINEFLQYAQDNRFTERSWVVKALDRDPHKDEIERLVRGQ